MEKRFKAFKIQKEKDYIFKCRKCSHNLYVPKSKLDKLLKYDCPECGEESYELWILIGKGILK